MYKVSYEISDHLRGGGPTVFIEPSLEAELRETISTNLPSIKPLLCMFKSLGDNEDGTYDHYLLRPSDLEKNGAKGDVFATTELIMMSVAQRIKGALEGAGVEVDLFVNEQLVEQIAS